jgi:hypothetical protein
MLVIVVDVAVAVAVAVVLVIVEPVDDVTLEIVIVLVPVVAVCVEVEVFVVRVVCVLVVVVPVVVVRSQYPRSSLSVYWVFGLYPSMPDERIRVSIARVFPWKYDSAGKKRLKGANQTSTLSPAGAPDRNRYSGDLPGPALPRWSTETPVLASGKSRKNEATYRVPTRWARRIMWLPPTPGNTAPVTTVRAAVGNAAAVSKSELPRSKNSSASPSFGTAPTLSTMLAESVTRHSASKSDE